MFFPNWCRVPSFCLILHYTTPRDIDNRRALKGATSSKHSTPYTDWEKTSTFDVSRDQQSTLPRRHPACQNVKFICPGMEGNLPSWSYSCTARTASGNGGVLDTNRRTPATLWNILSSGKFGKFHQRSLGSYQQGNTSTTPSFDNSALPASNVVLPTNYYLCQCPASFDNNDGIDRKSVV